MSSKTDEVRAALRKIIDQEGAGCLKDARRFRSLWMDYAPQNSKETKLILSAVQEGVGGILVTAIDKDEAGQRQCIRRCEQKLADAYIVEDGARFAIREIGSALKLDVDRLMPLPASGAAKPVLPKDVKPGLSDGDMSAQNRREVYPGREAPPRQSERQYEKFLTDNAAREIPAEQKKKKFPLLLLLLLVIGGAAAGFFLLRGANEVPAPAPPVEAQDEGDDLSGIVPPVLPAKEDEPEEDPPAAPDDVAVPAVLPASDAGQEEEPPAEQDVKPYEIDTIVFNLSGLHSMVMDNANNLYYIDGGIVYNTKDDITLDLEDFGSHEKFSYLAYDQYHDVVYLLVGSYAFGISTGYDPEIYDITDFSAPTLVLDSQSCPALSKVGFEAYNGTVAPQIAVLDNGALLAPFQVDSSVATYMINIEQQSATISDPFYDSGSYHHAKLLGDKVFALSARSSADVWTFAAQSSTKTSVQLDYDVLSNWGSSSLCAKYGVVYTYLDSIGVCTFNIDGTADILIPAESIAVKDYQSIDDVSVCGIAVGAADQIAYYDKFLGCIRLIRPAEGE